MSEDARKFDELLDLTRTLRGPGGCPWDRAQDFQTMRRYLLEEAYELLEAIDSHDRDGMLDELGDLLFIVLFYLVLAEEKGDFHPSDVIANTIAKMRRRHPHVFDSTTACNEREAFLSWESAKRKEKWARDGGSILDGLPSALPALTKARRLQERASSVGFDWKVVSGALSKLEEELGEFRTALAMETPEQIHAELGDVLFSLVNVARLLGLDPEAALQGTNAKFRRRFSHIEKHLAQSPHPLTLEEMDKIWDEVKRDEG
ncbi:MAG: nucleoside triphosphate pyrophosphohydrolase [Candidatus Eisenbacteria sp.]|nr:nucleoside triphosphate pyrophosphohydrolase [Candidatus Eisenbacteria bacterium]